MDRAEWVVETTNRAETFDAGRRFAGLLEPGDVVALVGDLGSGKTVFAQGVCAGLDIADPVTSPTFTLIQEYRGRVPVFHFDFYRLDTTQEIEDLGLPEYFEAGGVCLIEWAERGYALFPEGIFQVSLSRPEGGFERDPDRRRIRISGPADRGWKETGP